MAQHRDMRQIATLAAQKDSIESAAHFLAGEFGQVARSVAALARHFGTERRSGAHRRRGEPAKPAFLQSLRARVRQAQEDDEEIPLIGSVEVLLPATAQSQHSELAKKLLRHLAD